MAKLDLEGDDTHAATVEVVGMRQNVGVGWAWAWSVDGSNDGDDVV